MDNKLPWKVIKDAFKGRWLELIDFEWDWNSAYPSSAKVKNWAYERSELLSKIRQGGDSAGSVIMFIGAQMPVVAQAPEAAVL